MSDTLKTIKIILKSIFKLAISYYIFVLVAIVIAVTILIAHGLVISFNTGIDFYSAVNPLYQLILNDNWYEAYFLTRETVLLELPFVGITDKLFLSQNGEITLLEICSNLIKSIIAGFFSYILCRLNFFISSEKNKILFNVACGVWDSIAALCAVILITWINTLDASISWIILTAIVFLMFIVTSLMSYNNVNKQKPIIKLSRILIFNVKTLIDGIIHGIFISAMIYILHSILLPKIEDQNIALFTFIIIAFGTTILYEYIKRKLLKV